MSDLLFPSFEPPSGPSSAAPQNRAVPVVPVSALVSNARLILERQIGLTWVGGEISGFTRAASGHCYFTLKDARAQVRCVFFRHKAQFTAFALKDGLQVEVRATPSIFDARGEFQLNVETIRLAGIGALYERFAERKAKLEAAGWFAPERKRPLPPHPRSIGVVTSRHAAALRDVLTTLQRRAPGLAVILYPAPVQGPAAAPQLAQALRLASARAEVDVLIVCRGGGSIEDLWAFNEEIVAKAIYDCALPVISGVGHETDFTICDFVADVRAPTPTAAAELVAPDRSALRRALLTCAGRWRSSASRAIEGRMQRLDQVSRRLVHPAVRLAQQQAALKRLGERLARCEAQRVALAGALVAAHERDFARLVHRPLPQCAPLASLRDQFLRDARLRFERVERRLAGLAQNLAHLNPGAVLERGYAIVAKEDGAIVTGATQVDIGDPVRLTFAQGRASARITRRD